MKLPKELGTLNDLKEREARAFERMQAWRSELDDCYEYFLPNRNLFDSKSPGSNKMENIFDSVPIQAIQEGASKLQENIAPIWSRWAVLQPTQYFEELIEANEGVSTEEIQAQLDKQSDIIFDYINRSNFATQFYEASLELLIGTSTIRVDDQDDDNMPLVFHAVPQVGLAFEEGPEGTIETHWRKFKVQARNLTRQWDGFKPSQTIQDMIKNAPDSHVEVSEGVVFIPQTKTYYGCVWVKGEERISWMEDFGVSSPWVSGRYSKCAGEIRGRGPALQCLADAKSLNKIKEMSMHKAAIDLAGMYTATDDGVTNPYTMTISPGVVIPVGSNNTSSPSLQRLDTGANLSLAQFHIEDMSASIRRALFNDLRDPTSPVRSATEVAIESRELAKRIGSAFGRLQTEVLMPILRRVIFILTRKGLISPIQLDNRTIEIKFTSPLARSQDDQDVINVSQAIQFVMQNAGPDQAKIGFKLEKLGEWVGSKMGVPAEILRTPAEQAQIIQAGAQAAQAGMNVSQPAPPQ